MTIVTSLFLVMQVEYKGFGSCLAVVERTIKISSDAAMRKSHIYSCAVVWWIPKKGIQV